MDAAVKLVPKAASPSSRRAWIEIFVMPEEPVREDVALLAEGVDRNLATITPFAPGLLSPSSRRAWIEMYEY